jgi:hypothetical protein
MMDAFLCNVVSLRYLDDFPSFIARPAAQTESYSFNDRLIKGGEGYSICVDGNGLSEQLRLKDRNRQGI